VLADEDVEQNADRWYSHTLCGQEFCQILAQWVWNLRLELGQTLSSSDLRTTEFAKATQVLPPPPIKPAGSEKQAPPVTYGPPQWARTRVYGRFSRFRFSPATGWDSALPCRSPAVSPRTAPRARWLRCRVLYAARIGHCRSCPLRAQCQESSTTLKPRRVSAVLWPLSSAHSEVSPTQTDTTDAPEPLALAPVLWKDWPRCSIRRAWLGRIRSETVGLASRAPTMPVPVASTGGGVSTRAQRAHWRLSWQQRLARNARQTSASSLFVTLHGLPATFARAFGFDLLATA
jgi:hypothetical protein